MKLNLKSIGMAAALVAGLATLSIAGTPGKGPMSPQDVKEKVARMRTDLALTDDQATQIEQILNESSARAADGSAAKEQLRDAHKQTKERVRAVLTEEQRAKWDQLEKERHGSKDKSKEAPQLQ